MINLTNIYFNQIDTNSPPKVIPFFKKIISAKHLLTLHCYNHGNL
jgi:hypothetical protein